MSTKLDKLENQNYVIYSSLIVLVVAVLYFYRFHFVTLIFSYGLGCVACYYGLKSSILQNYVEQLKCHLAFKTLDNDKKNFQDKGCATCGSEDCSRHDEGHLTNPWEGLQIHKQLDQAIEDFYNTLLDQFVSSWYSKITVQPFFVDELKHQLRYASACLLQRAVKVNYAGVIMDRLLPCALRHFTTPVSCDSFLDKPPHPAVANRDAELKYLRCITESVMPYLLMPNDVSNAVFHVLIREVFAGWVLLSLTDVLADPYILNSLIILATGDETMAQLPTTPNYKVEFLETFVRQTDSVYIQRCKLYRLDLDMVINDQEYFYAFMQYMKTVNQINLLQFYKDIKITSQRTSPSSRSPVRNSAKIQPFVVEISEESLQLRVLNPELTAGERQRLSRERAELRARYCSAHCRLPAELAARVQQVPSDVEELRTSPALYEAARISHAILEKIMLPRFLHSEEFYNLLVGSRIPTGFHKQLVKKPQDKLLHTALKLGSKIKGALKTQSVEGQILDSLSNSEISDADLEENMDILKYLDSIAAEESLRDQDLRTYKVVLTNVETRLQPPPRRGPVRVFFLAVHANVTNITSGSGPTSGASSGADSGARLWMLERSEHDFHLLRSKLQEFHGDIAGHELRLPSRRDNSPMETLRYKYEDFLQRLLQKSLLQTSELLHLFLTFDGDFSTAVQASTLNANSTDLVNFYQSVTHKLRKEKGQHLESFLKNFLVSSDMERYQALKHDKIRDVDEAYEVNEDVELEVTAPPRAARNIHSTVFGNNYDLPSAPVRAEPCTPYAVRGLSQCLMFLLIKVLKTRTLVTAVVGTVLSLTKDTVDSLFSWYLNEKLKSLVSERRLAHLIRLGHGLLFSKKPIPRMESSVQLETISLQVRRYINTSVCLMLGSNVREVVTDLICAIQNPARNKQLVYQLLDICLLELFPELNENSRKLSDS